MGNKIEPNVDLDDNMTKSDSELNENVQTNIQVPNFLKKSMNNRNDSNPTLIFKQNTLSSGQDFFKKLESEEAKVNKNIEEVIDFKETLYNNDDYNTNKSKITDFVIDEHFAILILTIKESKFNQLEQKLKITPKGLEGSNRDLNNDGMIFFGKESTEFINDFCFNKEEGVNKQHFIIKYDSQKEEGYYIKNIEKSLVLIKVKACLVINDKYIISFGINHMVVFINYSNNKSVSYIMPDDEFLIKNEMHIKVASNVFEAEIKYN